MSDIEALWGKRYRTDLPGPVADNAVLRLLLAHHSVRAYRPDPLPPGTLEAAIAAASSAATSSNLQHWSVVAVTDARTREQLVALCGGQAHIGVAPLFLAWIVDLARLERIAARAGLGSEALDYQEAFLTATLDTGIAAQNAVTAFESLGLGTVYIGGLRNHPEAAANLLGLPPRSMAVVGLCVGMPDPQARPDVKPRLPQSVIVHRERYDATQEPEAIAAYDARASAYQQEQGLPPRSWADTIARRISSAAGLGGRHVIHDVLQRLGFPLK